MQLSRARFLSSALTTYQGACLMSVWANISSFAFEYSTQRERDSRSIGLSFQRLVGSSIRAWKRRSCSSSLTENQYLMRMMPGADEHPLELGARAQELLGTPRRCRSPSPARRRRGCTSCGRTGPSRRPPAGARRSAGNTTGSSRARSACRSATTRQTRGLRPERDAS